MRLRIIKDDSGEWIGQFPVGVYQCMMILPVSGSSYEIVWRPDVPTKMSGLMTAQYRAGRDALLGRFRKETGRTVAPFDEPPNVA
jgi:hypothetical protein